MERPGTQVMILGETGTGKELVAHSFHEKSDRASRVARNITPAAKKVIYQPEARARDPVRFPRWRVGLICSSMRNFLAGVILAILAAHDWPGNIRELANAIERASILAGNGTIGAEHLPTQFPARGRTQHSAAAHPPIASPHFTIPEGSPTLRDIEMSYFQAVLEKHNGNKPAASKELGISLKTLYNKINQPQQN